MKFKPFGKTGLSVSEVVLGGGFVGGILLNPDHRVKRTAFDLALENGINWIDTAPSYGQNKSEQNIGQLIKETGKTPVISTKVAMDVNNLPRAGDQIKKSVEESLIRLGQNSVEVLNLHNPITKETETTSGFGNIGIKDMLRSGGILDSLENIKKMGVVKNIGITALGDSQCCHDVISTGRLDAAQIYYNMINPSASFSDKEKIIGQDFSGLIDTCKKYEVGIMAIRVFAAGILASDQRHGREILITDDTTITQEEKLAKKLFKIIESSSEKPSEYGTRAEIALRYNLSNKDIDCTVVGLAEIGHLEQVLNGTKAGPLPNSLLNRINSLERTF